MQGFLRTFRMKSICNENPRNTGAISQEDLGVLRHTKLASGTGFRTRG